MVTRENTLKQWLKTIFESEVFHLTPLAGDASFRRYYRVYYQDKSYVVMDAPPEKEALAPFIDVQQRLAQQGVITPTISAQSIEDGFLLLDDLGDTLLLSALNDTNADELYIEALKTLLPIQQAETKGLPHFDSAFMLQEMGLFQTWFIEGHLKLTLTHDEIDLINNTFHRISEWVSQQPVVFIHRDYHSRNMLLLSQEIKPALGVIDFQDAMLGPYTYDLVSLLKDCYIQWPREKVLALCAEFYSQLPESLHSTLDTFIRDMDLCGLQRHLKVLGVFSRLFIRDHKPGYLKDLPLTLHYVLETLQHYPEFQSFYQWMLKRIRLP